MWRISDGALRPVRTSARARGPATSIAPAIEIRASPSHSGRGRMMQLMCAGMCLLSEEPSTPTRSQVDTSRQTERRASQPPRTSPPNRRLNATRPTSRTDGNQRRRTSSRAPACHPGAGATSRVSCGRYTAIRALLPTFWNFEIRERPVTGSTVVVVPSAEVVTVFVLTAAGAEATTTSDVATASSATTRLTRELYQQPP